MFHVEHWLTRGSVLPCLDIDYLECQRLIIDTKDHRQLTDKFVLHPLYVEIRRRAVELREHVLKYRVELWCVGSCVGMPAEHALGSLTQSGQSVDLWFSKAAVEHGRNGWEQVPDGVLHPTDVRLSNRIPIGG